jgi:hypothetical protein
MDHRRDKRFNEFGNLETYNFHATNRSVEIHTPLEITFRDISAGGLGIKSSIKLDPDVTISMNLDLDDENYVIIVKVVWCKSEGDVFSCGLKLIYMPDELVTYISSLDESTTKYSN